MSGRRSGLAGRGTETPAGPVAPEMSDASPDSATPTSWRVAALALLGGGVLLGYLAGRGKMRRVVPLATAGLAIGCAIPVARASRRPPISPETAAGSLEAADRRPTFTVLVGARDEASVLPALIGDISRQDYRDENGMPLFELVVVDDRSGDGSGDIALTAACLGGLEAVTRIIRREGEGLPDGKGAALTAAQPDVCRGDVIVVLDADARIEPWFLRRAAGYFAAGANAVTARRRMLDPGQSWLAGAQEDEQTVDGELNRGRWAMSGCSEFRGNGIMIRRELLAAVGGWRAAALTEDIDLSARVAAVAGERVAWAIDAEVWEEPVGSGRDLWQQRLRWAEGALRRAMEHGPAVVSSPRLSTWAKLDFVAYVGQLAVPPLVVGAAAAAATGRRRGLLVILAGYLGVGLGLGWDALRWERGPDGRPLSAGERLARALRVSLFSAIWLFTLPRALISIAIGGGPIRYVKMNHTGRAGDADRTQ